MINPPGESRNAGDDFYHRVLEMALRDASDGGKEATFTFVLAA